MPEIAQNRATKERLDAVLAQLTSDQIRFVIARSDTESDAAACRELSISRSTVSHWPQDVRDNIATAVSLMAQDGLVTALHIRRRNLAKAMAVKIKGLESDDERVRQNVATELIEWELGRATQRNEHTGADGGAIEIDSDNLTEEQRVAGIMAIYERVRARADARTDSGNGDIRAAAGASD